MLHASTAISQTPFSATQPSPFALKLVSAPVSREASPCTAEEAEALLQSLVRERWSRLSSEYDDPLDVLFANRVRQWTAGWGPTDGALYLLVWELQSWEQQPVWHLYRDGELIFRETEGVSKTRDMLLHQLMEAKQLPFASHAQFLEPLTRYGLPDEVRQLAAQALLDTILIRPEIFEHLKAPMFQALEAGLNDKTWPMLEMLKLHRLSHKNNLVWLFRHGVRTGLIRTLPDNLRLDTALTRLQEDYLHYGEQVPPMFQPAYEHAFQAFREIVTDGAWRIRLRMSPLQA